MKPLNNNIIQALEELPDFVNWKEIVSDLLSQPGVTMTTLATFMNTTKTSIGRLKNEGVEPKFKSAVSLFKLHATLCFDKQDEPLTQDN